MTSSKSRTDQHLFDDVMLDAVMMRTPSSSDDMRT
jgi:hypothetical protein